jgi:hypothetical protein
MNNNNEKTYPPTQSFPRFTNKDFRRIYREEKAKDVVYTPGLIIGKYVLEQARENLYYVYNLELKGFAQPDNPEKTWTEYITETRIYRPLPMLPWRPLPTPRLEPVNVEQLYSEIRQYIHARVDFTRDMEYDICTAWVMHTWRMENFGTSPYMFFFGPPGSGKTWAMEVLASVSFRPLFAMMSPASLYYATQDWHPTLFMDESEIYVKGKYKSEIINYLNAGYRRGQVITRVEENKATKQRELKMFQVFSPKSIAGTREFMGALPTRFIPIIMSRATREIENSMDEEIMDVLRAKLFTYRLNALAQNKETVIIRDFLSSVKDGRLKELFSPLIEVAPEKQRGLFVDCAIRTERERLEAEALTLESVVFSALASCRRDRLLIPIKELADSININLSSGEPLSHKTVGSVVSRLGFNKQRKGDGVYVVWDADVFERLSKRYKLVEMQPTNPVKPVNEQEFNKQELHKHL